MRDVGCILALWEMAFSSTTVYGYLIGFDLDFALGRTFERGIGIAF